MAKIFSFFIHSRVLVNIMQTLAHVLWRMKFLAFYSLLWPTFLRFFFCCSHKMNWLLKPLKKFMRYIFWNVDFTEEVNSESYIKHSHTHLLLWTIERERQQWRDLYLWKFKYLMIIKNTNNILTIILIIKGLVFL